MTLSLTTVFADLADPRIETANKLHKLGDILVIAACAVIAGADTWEEIAEYGRSNWTDVGAVVVVGRERHVEGKANTSTCHFYLTSRQCGAKKLASYIRGHWGIKATKAANYRRGVGRIRAGV